MISRAVAALALAGLAVLPLAGCAPSTQTVHGAVAVANFVDEDSEYSDQGGGDRCTPAAGLTDIREGAEVEVVDRSGKVLAVGELGAGALAGYNLACTFKFTVPSVPQGEKFYGVRVGNANRGVVHFQPDVMFGDGPQVSIG